MLTQTLVEAELAQRFKSALGTFTGTGDLLRLRMAYLSGLRTIWLAKEWRFRLSQSSLAVTSAIGKGPYNAPSGFYKLAQKIGIYKFAFDDNQLLAPVKDTVTATYDVWIDAATGKLYFMQAPGDATLTLSYQAEFDNDPANIATTVALFPSSVMDALYHFTKGNLYEDLPQFASLAEASNQKGFAVLDQVWQDYNQGQFRQRQMAPRGLNGAAYDGVADSIPLRGPQRFWRQA